MTLASASPLSATPYINHFGVWGVILVIFAETGLLIGFFLPGDSLLVLAGAFAATTGAGHPHLNLAILLPGVAVAAVLGGQLGYLIGRVSGPTLFERPDGRLFRQSHVRRTREALERYGETKLVFLARVIPVVRTFVNPLMGVVRMPAPRFAAANAVGGVVWAVAVTLIGYGVGRSVNVDTYILPITVVVIVLSLVPIGLEIRRSRARARSESARQDA